MQSTSAPFFINCSACVWDRIPAEVRFLSATAMCAKSQMAAEKCSILEQDAALSSVVVDEWHKYRRANSLRYSSEDIFHVELSDTVRDAKVIQHRSQYVHVSYNTVCGFQTLFIRNKTDISNKFLLLGDSICACICTRDFDVIAMKGARPGDLISLPGNKNFPFERYSQICLMIGGNSLSAHKERKALLPQEVVEEMKFIFEIFSLYCGVFVLSVLPRTTTTAIREQITQLNSQSPAARIWNAIHWQKQGLLGVFMFRQNPSV